MLCVLILYISGGTFSLKSTLNDKFLEKLFMTILFNLRVFAKNLVKGNRRRNTFRISFWFLAWDSYPGYSNNKLTHYLLDHGDFTSDTCYNHWIAWHLALSCWNDMSLVLRSSNAGREKFEIIAIWNISPTAQNWQYIDVTWISSGFVSFQI